ncbi:precorrin-8X methylmutase [Rhodovibrionaceae bacterium A322]
MSSYDYIKDPAAIYARSFAIVAEEAGLERLPEAFHPLATRLVHAVGMPDLVADLAYSAGAVAAGSAALKAGKPVLCDCEMVRSGIITRLLPAENPVLCSLNEPEVPDRAKAIGNTRSAAAVELWRDQLEGAVVAIGNAPTALFRLLEMLRDGAPKPAVVLGFPVGFVGAAESKDALAENALDLEFVALRGRRGGSALASAAVNALAGGIARGSGMEGTRP